MGKTQEARKERLERLKEIMVPGHWYKVSDLQGVAVGQRCTISLDLDVLVSQGQAQFQCDEYGVGQVGYYRIKEQEGNDD